jgi:hypothetical protein
MSENSSFEELKKDVIRKVHSGYEKRDPKKKRIPKLFIYLNIFVLFIVVLHFFRTYPEKVVYSSIVKHNGIQYSLDITDSGDKKNLMATMTVKVIGKDARFTFKGAASALTFNNMENVILKTALGENAAGRTVTSMEPVVFAKQIDAAPLILFAEKNSERVISAKKSLLSTRKEYLPVTVEFSIGIPGQLSTVMEMKYNLE